MNVAVCNQAARSPAVGDAESHVGQHRAHLLSSLIRARQQLRLWRQRHKQRRQLAELIHEEHLLRDMGVTHAEALAESQKPFWRA